jgi:hypothetical protein
MGRDRIEDLLNRAGSSKNDSSVTSSHVIFPDETAAADRFDEYCRRLLDIEAWKASSTPSSYELFDPTGEMVSDLPLEKGLFIRISIAASGKHDWVRIVSISQGPDELILTVSPTFDPTEKPQKPDVISHFFAPEATNNFCLQQSGVAVTMYVIGLSEHQNVRNADGVVETARNVAAANLGSYLGLQKSVWKEFCTNFLTGGAGAKADK